MRFSQRDGHLPEEARSLCVQLVREHEGKLSRSEIAAVIGAALSSLERWNRDADERCLFPPKPDGRGQHRRATAKDTRKVVLLFKRLEGTASSMSLEEFTELFVFRERSWSPDPWIR